MVDHHSYTHNLSSCEFKAWNNTGLNGIWTHDLCDTGAVLYQLLWVCDILVKGEECKWLYERSYIWSVERYMDLWWIITVIHSLSSCEIKAWKKFRPEWDSNPWTLWYQCRISIKVINGYSTMDAFSCHDLEILFMH